MNVSQLAERAGIDRTGLSDIENGHAQSPTLDTLQKIARAMRVRVSDLLAETDPPPLSAEDRVPYRELVTKLEAIVSVDDRLRIVEFAKWVAEAVAPPLSPKERTKSARDRVTDSRREGLETVEDMAEREPRPRSDRREKRIHRKVD